MRFRVRRGCHADRIAHDKQAACLKCAIVVSCAELELALRAGGAGHAQREGIVRVLDPSVGVDRNLIHPLQLEALVFTADVDCHTAVAILFRVVAFDPVSAGRKVDGIRAVCGFLRGQQIVRALHAVHVGIQLQGLDLCVVHTGQCDGDVAVCRQNACGQQTQQHHEHEQQAQNSFLHTSFLQSQNIYRKLLLYVGAETGAQTSLEKKIRRFCTGTKRRTTPFGMAAPKKRRTNPLNAKAELVPRIHPFRRRMRR